MTGKGMGGDGVSEYWNTGILEYWNTGILEYWNIGILEYWNIGILEYWNIGVLLGFRVVRVFRGCVGRFFVLRSSFVVRGSW